VKRKHRRLLVLATAMAALAVAAALVLAAFRDNLVFFLSPSDLAAQEIADDRRFRLGGMVEEGSLERLTDGVTVTFRVTDYERSVPVVYSGFLPDLFREGQGVVAEGHLRGDGVFEASEILAKHDEQYMPPEVADALKRAEIGDQGGAPR
jgi:cytochrome c-type biogenesis protein CcmE